MLAGSPSIAGSLAHEARETTRPSAATVRAIPRCMSALLAANDPEGEADQADEPRAAARARARSRTAAVARRGRSGRTQAATPETVLGTQTTRAWTAVVGLETRHGALALEAHARRALGARATRLAREREHQHAEIRAAALVLTGEAIGARRSRSAIDGCAPAARARVRARPHGAVDVVVA